MQNGEGRPPLQSAGEYTSSARRRGRVTRCRAPRTGQPPRLNFGIRGKASGASTEPAAGVRDRRVRRRGGKEISATISPSRRRPITSLVHPTWAEARGWRLETGVVGRNQASTATDAELHRLCQASGHRPAATPRCGLTEDILYRSSSRRPPAWRGSLSTTNPLLAGAWRSSHCIRALRSPVRSRTFLPPPQAAAGRQRA